MYILLVSLFDISSETGKNVSKCNLKICIKLNFIHDNFQEKILINEKV